MSCSLSVGFLNRCMSHANPHCFALHLNSFRLVCFTFLLALSNLGTSFASAILAKDTKTKDGELVVAATGKSVKTNSASEVFAIGNVEVTEEYTRRRKLAGCTTTVTGDVTDTECSDTQESESFSLVDMDDGEAIVEACEAGGTVTLAKTYGAQRVQHPICPSSSVTVYSDKGGHRVMRSDSLHIRPNGDDTYYEITGLVNDEQATQKVELGTAGNYAILASAGISTVAPSKITGAIAVSPIAATAMTGFGLIATGDATASTSGQVSKYAYAASYIAPTPAHLTTAVGDMGIAYTDAAGRTNPNNSKINPWAGEMGGQTLSQTTYNPDDNGVYTFGTDVTISTNVTFHGSAEHIFIIQMTGSLLVAENVFVNLTGGALAKNIFWQVAGTARVEQGAHMKGILLVKTAVTFLTGSNLDGRILAQTRCNLEVATITEPTN